MDSCHQSTQLTEACNRSTHLADTCRKFVLLGDACCLLFSLSTHFKDACLWYNHFVDTCCQSIHLANTCCWSILLSDACCLLFSLMPVIGLLTSLTPIIILTHVCCQSTLLLTLVILTTDSLLPLSFFSSTHSYLQHHIPLLVCYLSASVWSDPLNPISLHIYCSRGHVKGQWVGKSLQRNCSWHSDTLEQDAKKIEDLCGNPAILVPAKQLLLERRGINSEIHHHYHALLDIL